MKKLVLLLAVVFGASLVSCVNKSTSEAEACDSVKVCCEADSAVACDTIVACDSVAE